MIGKNAEKSAKKNAFFVLIWYDINELYINHKKIGVS
jgi:hypothetical protein